MIYRITFGFSGKGVGWAETHACQSDFDNPVALLTTMDDIATKRALMLGREFGIVGVRIARYCTDAGVRQRGVYLSKKNYANPNQTQAYAAEPSDVALLVKASADQVNAPPQFRANTATSFLGAPCDVAVTNAGDVDPGKAGLGAAFAQWQSAMIAARMGWLVSETIHDAPISTVSQNDSGTVNIQFQNNIVGPLVQGAWYKGRVRAVNGGNSPLNGEIVCQVTAANTITTREVIGIALAQQGGWCRFYKQVMPFVRYGSLALDDTVGNHKRGRPFGSKPGRARRRIRG